MSCPPPAVSVFPWTASVHTASCREEPAELDCTGSEPERRERLKMVDPVAVRELAVTKGVLSPDDPDALTFNVTGSGPDETARAIFGHTWP